MKVNEILLEMPFYGPEVTGLPKGIYIWFRTEDKNHSHSRFRLKVLKNNKWAAIYLVSEEPKQIKNINNSISSFEDWEIRNFITKYRVVISAVITGELDASKFEKELIRRRLMHGWEQMKSKDN